MAERTVPFDDLVNGWSCSLVIPDDGRCYPSPGEPKIGVRHPRCPELADLSVDLDCFYCPTCRWNGRISGAWAVDEIDFYLGRSEQSGRDDG